MSSHCKLPKCVKNVVSQGPLYKWTEHSTISFLKLQGRGGAPITPRGWIGVDGMDLDHNITQNIHIKIFLMKKHTVQNGRVILDKLPITFDT